MLMPSFETNHRQGLHNGAPCSPGVCRLCDEERDEEANAMARKLGYDNLADYYAEVDEMAEQMNEEKDR